MFKLECLNAKKGDCLILHYGDEQNPWRALFDGGPGGVYKKVLKPRLKQLRQQQADPQATLKIDLGIVSHIDDDHINGLIQMTNAMVKRQTNNRAQQFEFKAFWHNSFGDMTGGGETQAVSSASSGVLASITGSGTPIHNFDDHRAELVVASINQGRKLRNNLETLALTGNTPFDGLVTAPKTLSPPGGPKFHIVGPLENRLEELRQEWNPDASAAQVAEFADRSVANLSSIVTLIEANGKKMLMTGDARGDDILEGLNDAGFATDGSLHLNVLKVPHHGSKRNVTQEFFEKLPADIYVFSADGTHDNPDDATLEMITNARGQDEYEFVFTTKLKTSELQQHLVDTLDRLQQGHRFFVRFREDNDLSIDVEL